jgi:hypothetical protein
MIAMIGKKDFKRKNPFFCDVSPKPWEKEVYPDIPSIHLDSYTQVHELIAQKIKTPTKDIGIIFVGEKGSGKSHLLWRLCNDAQAADASLFFAAINPHIDPIKPMRYLVNEIARNFSYEVHDFAGCTQFHRLIAHIMQEFLQTKKNAEELFQNTESIFSLHRDKAISWLLDKNIKFHKKSILSLFQCCDAKTQEAALEKLKTGSEYLAQEWLFTLGLLISRYHCSLLISFDQLELIKNKEIRSFEKIILVILGYSQGIIPFILVRTDEWNEISTKKMDASVVQRFGNRIASTPCLDVHIEELIRVRLQFAIDEDRKKKGDMWLVPEVKKALPNDPTPRQVLNIARKIFDPNSHKLAIDLIAVTVAVYLEGHKRKYETIRKCKRDLELPDCDLEILICEIANHLPIEIYPGIVMRNMRKHSYFVQLPFEDNIIQFLQKNQGKSLRNIASRLPMTKEEFCDCITKLHGQKRVVFVAKVTVNGPSLLVYPTDSLLIPIPDEVGENVIQLREAMIQYPELNMRELCKKLPMRKKSLADTINYCIQRCIISVHVFSNNHEVDSKFFISDENTLKAGYDIVCKHAEYVMIHQLRAYLNWPRDTFDSLLCILERKGIIQMQAGDLRLLSADEQKDIYVRNNMQKMLLFWRKT